MCTPSLCVEKGVYYNGIRIRKGIRNKDIIFNQYLTNILGKILTYIIIKFIFRIIDSDDMSAVKCSCKCKEESDCNSWTFNGTFLSFIVYV